MSFDAPKNIPNLRKQLGLDILDIEKFAYPHQFLASEERCSLLNFGVSNCLIGEI
jgi:hypothetical protein